jgi:[acyl-carrier-protein] S-malonyltransferase
MLAFLFPGQGSQRAGMGRPAYQASATVRRRFDSAGAAAGRDYADVCFGGSSHLLGTTEFAQPTIVLCSICAWDAVIADGLAPDVVAGHSVGEIAALVAAGTLTAAAAMEAVEVRGRLMQSTAPGAMATIVGLSARDVAGMCAEAGAKGPVVVGLVNGPTNVVVSGVPEAVVEVEHAAQCAGALRVVRLPTERAFHSPLMEPVVQPWSEYVATLRLGEPEVPVVLSTTGTSTRDPESLRHAMVSQLTDPVRWDRVVHTLVDAGVSTALELGESKALRSLVRMMEPGIRTFSTLGLPSTASMSDAVRSQLAGGQTQHAL